MMRFMWDPKYSVNIKSIDTQHQTFFEIINHIYTLTSGNTLDQTQLLAIINELIKYGDFHLAYEEKYFQEFGYPEAKVHTAAHNEFRAQVKQYFEQLKAPHANISQIANDIADFAKNWLSSHILDMDHKYSQFFLVHDLR